jgi:hypothetical protein
VILIKKRSLGLTSRRSLLRKLTCRQALKADALRPKSQRRAAKVLLAHIKPEGYEGGSQLTSFIRAWRGLRSRLRPEIVLKKQGSHRWTS